MDFHFSAPRDRGGTLHLSPTNLHSIDSSTAMKKLRRSMSRSPSRANWVSKSSSSSPVSPCSPTRALSPFKKTPLPTSTTPPPGSNMKEAGTPSVKRPRPSLKRMTPLRTSSTPGRGPIRRALSDSSDNGNSSQSQGQSQAGGQENSTTPEDSPMLPVTTSKDSSLKVPGYDFSLHSTPAPILFGEPTQMRMARPAKSSPLKRSDGVMNLDRAYQSSHSSKRRSVHGCFSLADPSQGWPEDGRQSSNDSDDSDDLDALNDVPFRSPLAPRHVPARRALSHAKTGDKHSPLRGRRSVEFAPGSPGGSRHGSRSRPRSLLDSWLPATNAQDPPGSPQAQRPFTDRLAQTRASRQQPHPLSRIVSPTSPTGGMEHEQSQASFSSLANPDSPAVSFSKSLPIGAIRPSFKDLPKVHTVQEAVNAEPTFATPELYKIARPDPAAFRSTGLISKRHRNPDDMPPPPAAHAGMPDTPCKKVPLGHVFASSPTPVNSIVKTRFAQPEFVTPLKPFSATLGDTKSTGLAGGYTYGVNRGDSFTSLDGIESNKSPSGQGDSQSSADELPPTPTKQVAVNTPQAKQQSLRSTLFGRRASFGPNTFVEPEATEGQDEQLEISCKSNQTGMVDDTADAIGSETTASFLFKKSSQVHFDLVAKITSPRSPLRDVSPLSERSLRILALANISNVEAKTLPPNTVFPPPLSSIASRISPRTPADSGLPDPSGLSITPRPDVPSSPIFGVTMRPPANRPPETPTHRDSGVGFGAQPSVTPSQQGMLAQDVDPVLTARFSKVARYNRGQFSDVFKVYLPPDVLPMQSYFNPSVENKPTQTPGADRIWIVKRTRSSCTSVKYRERKMREVDVMKALRGSDHVVQLVDSWESSGYLYIQTEFCEEGNMYDFLLKIGNKGRLDDFRIWKILIELSLGLKHIHDSGFMHLDLKPANVFIDFGGYLKIGDFGLACEWPAPDDIEGEGDRRYMGPDLLQGNFDKPADVFALGMMMFEIAGNYVLPDYGTSWQKLRSGDFSDLPSLTSGTSSAGIRDIDNNTDGLSEIFSVPDAASCESLSRANLPHEKFNSSLRIWNSDFIGNEGVQQFGLDEHFQPPPFMLDGDHEEALDKIVYWMMSPNPEDRPTVDQLLNCHGVLWVGERRRSGAVVYEGQWGPSNHVLMHGVQQEDEEMLDVP